MVVQAEAAVTWCLAASQLSTVRGGKGGGIHKDTKADESKEEVEKHITSSSCRRGRVRIGREGPARGGRGGVAGGREVESGDGGIASREEEEKQDNKEQ